MNNVVGKTLIIMQLVFSVLFICFAGAVYSFKGEWKNRAQQLETDIANKQQVYEEKEEEFERIKAEIKIGFDELVLKNGDLRTEIAELQTSLTTQSLEREVADSNFEQQKADAEAKTSEAAARRAESENLYREVESLRERIAELREKQSDLENQLLEAEGQATASKEVEADQLETIADLKRKLRYAGVNPREPLVSANVPEQIEKVDGFIEATHGQRDQEFLQVTIGSDDRIYKDMKLIVYRKDDYVCQARVMKVWADKAVCVVIEDTKERNIKVGDNVTTKL